MEALIAKLNEEANFSRFLKLISKPKSAAGSCGNGGGGGGGGGGDCGSCQTG